MIKAVYVKDAWCSGSGSDLFKWVSGVTKDVLSKIEQLNVKHGCELAILVDSHTEYQGQQYKRVEIKRGRKFHKQINDADYEIVETI